MVYKKNNSISKKMLAAAKKARHFLPRESVEAIAAFVTGKINADGGFRGRSTESDLYYTLFGMECLQVLGRPLPNEQLAEYLRQFKDGEGLDFVHLTCLARSLAKLHKKFKDEKAGRTILKQLEQYRSDSGGYRLTKEAQHESIYAAFLALLVYEDMCVRLPNPDNLLQSIKELKTPDGVYADQLSVLTGTTTVTAAAAVILSYLKEPVDNSLINWLLSRHSKYGGFKATINAPLPDLLSTASALFALNIIENVVDKIIEPTLTFIEDMWNDNGGFCGNILDETSDCEYTFYGLLSLGILEGDTKVAKQ